MDTLILLVVGLVLLEVIRRRIGAPEWPTSHQVIALGVVGLLLFGLWYVTVYDTAAGRCSRGDLGACLVVEAQQQRR